jgi:hypothetical protein
MGSVRRRRYSAGGRRASRAASGSNMVSNVGWWCWGGFDGLKEVGETCGCAVFERNGTSEELCALLEHSATLNSEMVEATSSKLSQMGQKPKLLPRGKAAPGKTILGPALDAERWFVLTGCLKSANTLFFDSGGILILVLWWCQMP